MEFEVLPNGLPLDQGIEMEYRTLSQWTKIEQEERDLNSHKYQMIAHVPKPSAVKSCLLGFLVTGPLIGLILVAILASVNTKDNPALHSTMQSLEAIVGTLSPILMAYFHRSRKLAKVNAQNAEIDRLNAEHAQYNKGIDQMIARLAPRKQELQGIWAETCSSWYPKDYITFDAVNYFHSALANHRENTLAGLVNSYENYCHQRRLEQNQQKAQQQMQQGMQDLAFTNALGQMVTASATRETNRRLDNLTDLFTGNY